MSEKLRVAVIGAGQIAQRAHLLGYIQAGSALVALCDNAHPELESIAVKYQVERTYRNWVEMLTDGGFESEHRCSLNDPSGWFGAVQAFVDAIQLHAPSPVSAEEGRLAMAAVLAASESAEQGKIISLNLRG